MSGTKPASLRRQWKRCESEIASALGGERVPVTGRKGADIAHGWLAPEVKSRESVPKWLVESVRQAREGAAPGKLPVVIVHQVGDRHTEDLVVVRFSDWRERFGAAATGGEAAGEPWGPPA